MMLSRSNDVELDFDFNKVLEKIRKPRLLCSVFICKDKFPLICLKLKIIKNKN